MAKSLKTSISAKNNLRKPLSLVDVECPVCREIFIEPVTLPCKHCFCLRCFDGTMESVSLQCPMCRTRVGGWLRTATKDNRVVDIKLWELIQRDFSDYVKARQRGEVTALTGDIHPIRLSKPGELRKEYELQKLAIEEEARKKREEEARASADLIKKLQDKEKLEIAKKAMKLKQSLAVDEEIARKLMMEEMNRLNRSSPSSARKTTGHSTETKGSSAQVNGTENKENKALTSTSGTVKGPMDIFLAGKKKIPSSSKKLVPIGSSDNVKAHLKNEKMTDGEKARSASGLSTGSCDSINQEMHHFKPIKVAPRTPPKTMPDGRIIEPKIVKITPMHLNFSSDDRSEKLPLQKLAVGMKDGEQKFTSSRSSVVRELFHSGNSSVARGPSAFCETGALEGEVSCDTGDNPSDPTAAKVQKVDFSRVMDDGCTLEEQKDDVKGPERKRKRRIPCGSGDLKEGCSYGESSQNKLDPELQLMGVTKEILEEQMRREAQLLQEQEDLKLARQLQREWEDEVMRIDRRKGSQLEYQLRSRGPTHSKDASRKSVGKSKRKQAVGGPRQQSLDEIMSSKGKTKQ